MQRIDTVDGLYADPSGGDPGTTIKAFALNAIQEEIVNAIEGSGFTLNPADDTQLFQAIQAGPLFNGGTINGSIDVNGSVFADGLSFDNGVNLLDEYETGVWTPTITGATTAGSNAYSVQSGSYVRIGDLVTVEFRVNLDGTSGALDSTGALSVSGLPFSVASANSRPGLSVSYTAGINLGVNDMIMGVGFNGDIEIYHLPASGTGTVLDSTEATDSFQIRGTMSYIV